MTTLSVEEVLAKVLGSDDEDGEFGNLDSDSEEEESLDSPVISSLSGNPELSLDFIRNFGENLTSEDLSGHCSESSQYSDAEQQLDDLEVSEDEQQASSKFFFPFIFQIHCSPTNKLALLISKFKKWTSVNT